MEFSGVITLNCDLMFASSVSLNSLGVRKSSAVPIRNSPLYASFSEGVSARHNSVAQKKSDAERTRTNPREIVGCQVIIFSFVLPRPGNCGSSLRWRHSSCQAIAQLDPVRAAGYFTAVGGKHEGFDRCRSRAARSWP